MPLSTSDDDFSRYSGNTAAVVAEFDRIINSLIDLVIRFRSKVDAAEQTCSAAEQKCSAAEQKCSAAEQKCSAAEQKCSVIEQKYLSLEAEFSKLESHASRVQAEKETEIERLKTSERQKDLELSENLDRILHLTENAARMEARVAELEAELVRCQVRCQAACTSLTLFVESTMERGREQPAATPEFTGSHQNEEVTIMSDGEMQEDQTRRRPGRPPLFRGVRGPGRPPRHRC